RMLAIAAPKRASVFPDVPTMSEAGVKDMEAYAFQGLLGPANLPANVVTRLNTALNAALKDPAVVAKFNDYGTEIQGGSSDAFLKYARSEANRWGPVIKNTGI